MYIHIYRLILENKTRNRNVKMRSFQEVGGGAK